MNKRLVWFTELILWALFILALIFGFTYSFATSENKNHSYYMFFQDVDGLTKGSPVRMMGYQIGYVRDVKVFKDNIFVSFLVTEKDVIIPSGSTAQVEFYGLGGSKSLEIEPPSEHYNGKEIIMTKNPYRLENYYRWGHQISSILENTMNNTSMMLDAYTKSDINIPFLTKSAQKMNNMIQSFIESEDDFVEDLNSRFQNFNKNHENLGTKEEVHHQNNSSETAEQEDNKNEIHNSQ
ncbi:MAG: MlaD family protein [Candidatus Gastranaerophilales bacterium]|nr:MlaD family protein [Candidatus Gastranaerophilales bacterium]